MSNYEMKKLCEVRLIEIKNICLALGIDGDLFMDSFFAWYKSSTLSGNMVLDMCKTRLLAGRPMPWEKEETTTDGWISVEERMPTEDALYLIHAPSINPDKPFINTAWFNPNNDMGWELVLNVWADAITHWMPLPDPPSKIKEK